MAAGMSPIEIRTVAAANGTVATLVHPPVRASSVLASAFAVSSMLQQPDQHPGWLQALARVLQQQQPPLCSSLRQPSWPSQAYRLMALKAG